MRITSFEQPRFTAFFCKFFSAAPIARIFGTLYAGNSCQLLYNKDNRDKAIRGATVPPDWFVCVRVEKRLDKPCGMLYNV